MKHWIRVSHKTPDTELLEMFYYKNKEATRLSDITVEAFTELTEKISTFKVKGAGWFLRFGDCIEAGVIAGNACVGEGEALKVRLSYKKNETSKTDKSD